MLREEFFHRVPLPETRNGNNYQTRQLAVSGTIRRKGYPTQPKTFETRKDAEAWAKVIESEMVRNVFTDRSEAERTTLLDLLIKYGDKVTPTKRGSKQELSRLRHLQRHPLALRSLASLKSSDFAAYRDERLLQVSSKTVHLELGLFSVVLNTARKDWSIPIDNPITHIRKPGLSMERDRRLQGDEESRLLEAANDPTYRRVSWQNDLTLAITLAIETGMRRGEIAMLDWKQVDWSNHVILLEKGTTKNGDRRTVPLSVKAETALRAIPRPINGGKVFGYSDSNGLGHAFARACERAGISGLTFHDLRHEAASRFAPQMPVATLAKVMGWRTIQMAMRYYNPTASELVAAVRRAA